jgi:putative peptidoglycan binding protein
MAYAPFPQNNPGPVGDGDYVVVEGDCMESIAAAAGFLWTTIWNHPQNAALKKARVTQNVLLPGDRLYIPDKNLKVVERPTDQRHRFVRKGLPCKLRLCLKWLDEPRRNAPYVLDIDGTLHNGTTDDEGCIEVLIPPQAASGRLTVGADPVCQQVYTLDLGGLDPITETVGIQKRLRNLGFHCEPTGEMDDATASAIARFQKKHALEPTGELDASTIDKLKSRHGS